jgi:hypothetical protein
MWLPFFLLMASVVKSFVALSGVYLKPTAEQLS